MLVVVTLDAGQGPGVPSELVVAGARVDNGRAVIGRGDFGQAFEHLLVLLCYGHAAEPEGHGEANRELHIWLILCFLSAVFLFV
jgi:hypothetical protein